MLQAKINNLENNTPQELKEANNWLLWKLEPKVKEVVDGQAVYETDEQGNVKYNKVPYNAITGRKASYTKREECTSFKNAIESLELNKGYYNGLGFVLFEDDDFLFIDLDDKKEEMNTYANSTPDDNIVTYFMLNTESYTEISQSGEGLHIIAYGKKPNNIKCRNDDIGLEVYDSSRFIAFTGDIFEDRKELNSVDDNTIKEIAKKYDLLTAPKNTAGKSNVVNDIKPLNLEDNEIKKQLMNIWEKEGHKEELNHLLSVGYHDTFKAGDKSAQDMAILYDLAVITQGNSELMRSFFVNNTALNREKTERLTAGVSYLDYSINNALNYYYENKANYQNDKNTAKKTLDYGAFPWNDTGKAERFLADSTYGDCILWVEDLNSWFTYKNGIWSDKGRNAQNYVTDFYKQIAKSEPIFNTQDEEEKEELQEAWKKQKNRLGNKSSIENTLWALKNLKNATLEDFDTDDYLLNCKNGVLNLETFELLPHDAKYLITKQIATDYDPSAKCPRWEQFINEIFQNDQELIKFVQRAIGYSLTGSTSEQVMFLLIGKGSNGKGVFTNTLQHLLGNDKNYATTVQADSLLKSKKRSGHSDDLAGLKGARFVASSEPNENEALNEGLVKQLTGGDMISASFKGGRTFSYMPRFKIWLSTNHMPHIAGTDDGIWRRLVIIPFNRQFLGEEKDPLLQQKLIKDELQGILNWCIEGLKEYNRIGLNIPESLEAHKKSVRKDHNPIARWLDECCEFTEQATTQQKELMNEYNSWAYKNGEKEYKAKAFGSKIRNIENVRISEKANRSKLYNLRVKESNRININNYF